MEILINGHKVNEETTLEFVPNPKRPGFKAHARYAAYQEATTIEEFFKIAEEGGFRKYATADLRYDEEHGHLKLFRDGEQINAREE